MATTSNLNSIIYYYTGKTQSAFIDFREFCGFMKKYAEHHVEEKADLVKYLGNPKEVLIKELEELSEQHLVAIIKNNDKQTIISIPFFTNQYIERFKEMSRNENTPYPIIEDLPKSFPVKVLQQVSAAQYIATSMTSENPKSMALYIMDFERNIPAILLPACISARVLIETAQKKIKRILRKEQYHDYFLKKLRNTNASHEISIKNFYNHFVDEAGFKYSEFAEGDDYYIFNQLLYYIKQDFEKIPDKTPEDINVLQAGRILELQSAYLKDKMQKEHKKQEALKELEAALNEEPYYYSIQQILKFQDKNGKLLYGKYSEEDLKNFLQEKTTEGKKNELPTLLIFKVASGTRYYVYKNNVLKVVIKLCNEANLNIERTLESEWHKSLINFQKLPEMTNDEAFEKKLEKMIETTSPVLYELLTANFMSILAQDTKNNSSIDGSFQLFYNDELLPYSELLMLYKDKIYSNAKKSLPFFYSIPIISWIYKMFTTSKNKKKQVRQEPKEEAQVTTKKTTTPVSKEKAIAAMTVDIIKEMVPEGSSLDMELNSLIKQWNIMISKNAYNNLVEDVNSLIRDYMRRVLRTLSVKTFSKERVEELAVTLTNTPSMKKIPDTTALTSYVALYILKLLKDLK